MRILSLAFAALLIIIFTLSSPVVVNNNLQTKRQNQATFFPDKLYASSQSYGFMQHASNYYYMLDNGQKRIYDFLKNLTPLNEDIDIELYRPITASGSDFKDAETELTRLVQGALDAVLKDYPEIFWLRFNDDEEGCSYAFNDSEVDSSGDITFDSFTFSPAVMPTYIGQTHTIVTQLENAVNSFTVSGNTRYQKLLSIHDGLADRIIYDSADIKEQSHDAFGALIAGEAVCEGYAEAFKLICDRLGIPCVLVVGDGVTSAGIGAHMWNMVRMEDGKWYAVDTTWDDHNDNGAGNGEIYYDFFLVGKNTRDVHFQKRTFVQSHISDSKTHPPLSSDKYDPDTAVSVKETTTRATTTTTTAKPTTTTSEISTTLISTSLSTESITEFLDTTQSFEIAEDNRLSLLDISPFALAGLVVLLIGIALFVIVKIF